MFFGHKGVPDVTDAIYNMSFQKLCQSVLTVLQRRVRPRYQRTCLETLRILSRDKRVLAPVATKDGMLLLGRLARLHGGHNGDDNQNRTHEDNRSEDEEKVVVEALKCLCNVVYNSPEAQQVSVDMQLAYDLCASLSTSRTWHHEVGLFTLRLIFLLSALRSDVRGVMKREWHAVRLLSEVLEHTLDVHWVGPHEAAGPDPQAPPMPADDNERAMETLKALFNLTLSSTDGDVSVSYNRRQQNDTNMVSVGSVPSLSAICVFHVPCTIQTSTPVLISLAFSFAVISHRLTR